MQYLAPQSKTFMNETVAFVYEELVMNFAAVFCDLWPQVKKRISRNASVFCSRRYVPQENNSLVIVIRSDPNVLLPPRARGEEQEVYFHRRGLFLDVIGDFSDILCGVAWHFSTTSATGMCWPSDELLWRIVAVFSTRKLGGGVLYCVQVLYVAILVEAINKCWGYQALSMKVRPTDDFTDYYHVGFYVE